MRRIVTAWVLIAAYFVVPLLAATATDSFTRADAQIGANWTDQLNTCDVISTTAADPTGGDCESYYSATSFTADHCSQVTISSGISSGANYAIVTVRAQQTGASRDAYDFYTDGGSGAGHTDIREITNASGATLSSVTTTFANGDTMKLCAVGTTITAYKNGATLAGSGGSATDATLSAGAPGLGFFGTSVRSDDWIGSDVSATTTPKGLLMGILP